MDAIYFATGGLATFSKNKKIFVRPAPAQGPALGPYPLPICVLA